MVRKEKLLAMLETDPDDPFLHYAVAKECLSGGERGSGIERLREIVERFPDYHAAHFQLGRCLFEDGQSSEAREIIERGIVAAQQEGDAHAVKEMSGFLDIL